MGISTGLPGSAEAVWAGTVLVRVWCQVRHQRAPPSATLDQIAIQRKLPGNSGWNPRDAIRRGFSTTIPPGCWGELDSRMVVEVRTRDSCDPNQRMLMVSQQPAATAAVSRNMVLSCNCQRGRRTRFLCDSLLGGMALPDIRSSSVGELS